MLFFGNFSDYLIPKTTREGATMWDQSLCTITLALNYRLNGK